jgi:hypothetical protein
VLNVTGSAGLGGPLNNSGGTILSDSGGGIKMRPETVALPILN